MATAPLADAAARHAALSAHDRTLLVEAGAGSGKTAVLAGRIAMMLMQGILPKRVAAVTFTELAASELLQRGALLRGWTPARRDRTGTKAGSPRRSRRKSAPSAVAGTSKHRRPDLLDYPRILPATYSALPRGGQHRSRCFHHGPRPGRTCLPGCY